MAPRLLLPCVLLIVAAGCGSEQETGAPPPAAPALAELLVRVDGDGARGPAKPEQLRLRCNAPGESAACAAAAKLALRDFRPVPADVACTEIFGGSQTARVSGTLRGDPVSGTFARSNGCEITRWEAMAPLLEQVG